MAFVITSAFVLAALAGNPPMAASTGLNQGPGTAPTEGITEGIEIPFELGPRGHILIDVAVNRSDAVTFVLDTGAGRTAINRTRLGALGLVERPSGDTLQGAHGRVAMGVTDVASLAIGDAAFGSLELVTMDLTAVEAGTMTLFGVLGYDILSHYDVAIDFGGRTVVFHPRAEELAACVVCEGEISVPFALAEGTHIRIEISISDQPIQAILDTGSGRSGMNGHAARAIGIDVPAAAPGSHAPALQVGALHLGDGVLARDVIVGVVDLPVFEGLGVGDGPALLLGTGALAGRRVGISYGLQRLSIQ